MPTLIDLWLPILVSGVAVWIASALSWMVMPHHKGDMQQLPNEDDVMAAVRKLAIAPGLYFFPHMKDCGKMKSDPVAKERFERGPHGMLHLWPPDAFAKMGRNMMLSFLFYLLVGTFVAYLATLGIHTHDAKPDFMSVFRFTGTAAVMAYSLSQIPHQIWFGIPVRVIMSCLVDGIAYGLITGAVFGLLWPSAV